MKVEDKNINYLFIYLLWNRTQSTDKKIKQHTQHNIQELVQ